MKFSLVPVVLGIVFSFAGPTQAHDDKESKSNEKIERTTVVDPQASITLCVMSGTLTVRGWERNEVRVRSTDADMIDFRRVDKIKDTTVPAQRVDVMVVDKHSPKTDCQALADVEMDVPQGATVQVQTRDGNINITGVAGAYAGSQNGDIAIERATKFVEAGSVGGSISLKNSSGRVNLSSAGGGVEVDNVKPVDADDTLEVGTVSGDIQLDRVTNTKVLTKTVNGNVTITGPLARSGYYGFTTMGGDVVMVMPHDASFTLMARVSEQGDIVSDFPLKYIAEETRPATPTPRPAPKSAPSTPNPPSAKSPTSPPSTAPKGTGPIIAPMVVVKPVVVNPFKRLKAVYGSGDATIALSSFGGTLRLTKM